MRKKKIAIMSFLMALFVFVLAGCGEPQKMYSLPEFTFSIPESWVQQDSGSSDTLQFRRNSSDDFTFVQVDYSDVAIDLSDAQEQFDIVRGLKDGFGNFELVDQSETKINGISGFLVTYSAEIERVGKVYGKIFQFNTSSGKAGSIASMVFYQDKDRIPDVLESIISTVKFTK